MSTLDLPRPDAASKVAPMSLPFSLRLAPIERMLLLDFTGDPLYRSLEVQQIESADGRGVAVILLRSDGTADVYLEPHLRLAPEGYEWVGKGLTGWYPTPMSRAAFEIASSGVQVDLRFPLADGRIFDLRIHERRSRQPVGFNLLAPAGFGSAAPTFLPVFWLQGVVFVQRRGANIEIRIDDEPRRLPRTLLPWQLPRYCATPVLGMWNIAHDGPPVDVEAAAGFHEADGTMVEVVGDTVPAVASLGLSARGRCLRVTHSPAVPAPEALHDGAFLRGRVRVCVDEMELLGGAYRMRRHGDRVELRISIDQGWRPQEQHWMGAVLFRALVFFRTWPTTYRWSATVDLEPPATLTSHWERR